MKSERQSKGRVPYTISSPSWAQSHLHWYYSPAVKNLLCELQTLLYEVLLFELQAYSDLLYESLLSSSTELALRVITHQQYRICFTSDNMYFYFFATKKTRSILSTQKHCWVSTKTPKHLLGDPESILVAFIVRNVPQLILQVWVSTSLAQSRQTEKPFLDI